MVLRMPSDVGGYVLAGGKSSRMGRDKALLELQGKPLVLHAVVKLRRVCRDVHILSSRPELDAYAPLVRDLHPDCGPLGGIESALSHSRHDWNLFMAVDMPFLPSALLDMWVRATVRHGARGTRLAVFEVDGAPQPTLLMAHKDVTEFIASAIEEGKFKLQSVLMEAGESFALRRGLTPGEVFRRWSWTLDSPFESGEEVDWRKTTEVQERARHLWFANLNTPEEFAEAERFASALDT